MAYATGYTGLGVAATRFGARVALDLVDGRDSEATRLRFVRQKPVPFPPEPLRSLGIRLTRQPDGGCRPGRRSARPLAAGARPRRDSDSTANTVDIDAARETDLDAITAIYNDVIATSTAVFNDAQVDVEDRRRWWRERRERGFPVLVAREGGQVLGFGSFGDFRAWPGYRTTVEHTVHVAAAHRRRGIGRQLVEALIRDARALGMHVMIAGVDAANEGSLALHTAARIRRGGPVSRDRTQVRSLDRPRAPPAHPRRRSEALLNEPAQVALA